MLNHLAGRGAARPAYAVISRLLGLWLSGAVLALLLAMAGDARAEPTPPAPVRVGEAVVFTLSAHHAGRAPSERAKQAAAALALVASDPELREIRVVRSDSLVLVQAGDTPIVELSAEDAARAGEASLAAYGDKTASAIRAALASERQRSRIAETVFSFSLVVFFALIAFYLIKKLAIVAERARAWLDERGDGSLAVSIKSIELVRPAVVKSSAVIALGLGKWLGQFGIFYAWLVIVLSLFEATRGYTERLTGFVLSPLSQLFARAFIALPLLVVAGFAALAVFVLVRFTGLFLASVARRETALSWLPADLAAPASVLLRISIVVAALVFGAPIVTGSTDGALGRTGAILLVALGLAATPLFACGLTGAVVLFGRRLSVGDYVQVRGQLGRISSINLLDLRLLTSDGTEQRIPHLLLLACAIEQMGPSPRLSVDLVVPSDIAPARVLELLTASADRVARDARAELVSMDPTGLRYRITATLVTPSGRSSLLQGLIEGLGDAGIALAHGAPLPRRD